MRSEQIPNAHFYFKNPQRNKASNFARNNCQVEVADVIGKEVFILFRNTWVHFNDLQYLRLLILQFSVFYTKPGLEYVPGYRYFLLVLELNFTSLLAFLLVYQRWLLWTPLSKTNITTGQRRAMITMITIELVVQAAEIYSGYSKKSKSNSLLTTFCLTHNTVIRKQPNYNNHHTVLSRNYLTRHRLRVAVVNGRHRALARHGPAVLACAGAVLQLHAVVELVQQAAVLEMVLPSHCAKEKPRQYREIWQRSNRKRASMRHALSITY